MDKTKFLYATAGLDSEGFIIERYEHPLRATIESHMERICVTASRTELCGNSHCKDGCYVLAVQNPKGWREIDGVKLPSVATWAEQGTLPPLTGWSDEALDAGLAVWKAEGVRIVGERRKVQR